mmetsp:Transcript_17180/g.35904  ORF Transcript_17180/g.35904 Transcript_17180/m.35904 type:complete len:251 (+) Transcript_17180:321-1073(+)
MGWTRWRSMRSYQSLRASNIPARTPSRSPSGSKCQPTVHSSRSDFLFFFCVSSPRSMCSRATTRLCSCMLLSIWVKGTSTVLWIASRKSVIPREKTLQSFGVPTETTLPLSTRVPHSSRRSSSFPSPTTSRRLPRSPSHSSCCCRTSRTTGHRWASRPIRSSSRSFSWRLRWLPSHHTGRSRTDMGRSPSLVWFSCGAVSSSPFGRSLSIGPCGQESSPSTSRASAWTRPTGRRLFRTRTKVGFSRTTTW